MATVHFSLRSLVVSILFGSQFVSLSQDSNRVPDLQRQLATATSDTARALLLEEICFNLIQSAPHEAEVAGLEALELGHRSGHLLAIGGAHNSLGWLAVQQGHLPKAQMHLDSALLLFQRVGSPVSITAALTNQGWLAERRGDLAGALGRFKKALQLSEETSDSAGVAVLLYSIGSTYSSMKDPAMAREYMMRSMEIEQQLGKLAKQANCLMGIANTYLREDDPANAEQYYAEAAKVYASVRDLHGMGLVAENRGNLHRSEDPLTAIALYQEAFAYYDTLQSDHDKAYILYGLGMSEKALARSTQAEEHFNTGIELARSVGALKLEMQFERGLAELASELGDSKAVLDHYERFTVLKDSIQGKDTQRELARLRTELETERKEKDNQLLLAKNSEQLERLKRREIMLYGSGVVGILALLAAILFWRNWQQKRKHADVLDVLNKQLSESNAEITTINGLLEMKVLRSQMNPHFIYNCLNSAAQMTQAGQSIEALAYLQGFARLLRMVLDHSVNDHVTIQEEMAFLRQYLKLEAHRLDGLIYEVDAEEQLLKEDVEIPSLIVQPFVENAVWHGLAEKQGERRITVHFGRSNGSVICQVEDNGIGRKAAETHAASGHRSLGMQLTNERLQLLSRRIGEHGACTITDLHEANGGTGTRVILELALDPDG